MGRRIGHGEVTGYGFTDRALSHGRELFLSAVADQVPEVLADLRDSVLPEFTRNEDGFTAILEVFAANRLADTEAELTVEGADPGGAWAKYARDGTRDVPTANLYSVAVSDEVMGDFKAGWQQLAGLRRSLADWGHRFNLTHDWTRDAAMSTLGFWHWVHVPQQLFWFAPRFNRSSHPVSSRSLRFAFHTWSAPFIHAGWDPFTTTWARYRRIVGAAFRDHLGVVRSGGEPTRGAVGQFEAILAEYRTHVLMAWLKAGHKTTKAKSEPKIDWDEELPWLRHFEWLALYQCRGWSPSRIAQSAGLAESGDTSSGPKNPRSAIDKAVRKTASNIGLSLRTVRRGRPRRG